jgi:hypothetical protein
MKLAAVIYLFAVQMLMANQLDLSGRWQLQLDPSGTGTPTNTFSDVIVLPGTISEEQKGDPLVMEPILPALAPEHLNFDRGLMFGRPKDYTNENASLMHLYQRFSSIGPAWYLRTVDIPARWLDKDVQLTLERAMWETRLWVNGHYVGAQNSLVCPHRYEVGSMLKPGHNEILLRVDNKRQLDIGNPHAYTEESQTIWNGIIGRMTLSAQDPIRIDRLDLRPDLAHLRVQVTVATHNDGAQAFTARLNLSARPANFHGPTLPAQSCVATIPAGDSEQTFFYPFPAQAERWSEFNPKLYRMTAALDGPRCKSKMSADFGLREFRGAGRQFTINGQPVFLRGTVECCVFPKTGYPDMTGKEWRKIFSTAKACGLNHMRFHTWCPPEIAFKLADEAGFYLEIELPDWSFQIGKDSSVTDFFRKEGERMIHEYGNHPSWVMFTMGNELKGNYEVLDKLVAHFRALDPTLLFDSTTYPSSKRGKIPGPLDDYYISQDTRCGRVRGQDILNDTIPNTISNYEHNAACVDVPLISHEVGQYCIFPNVAEVPKYDGVLRPTGFEAIRNDLMKKGRLTEAHDYTRDSGELAVLLYKEEIERALRTTNQAGFQLLQLNDFPGQGTSTVGLFDSFWDSKGLISPKQFHEFCGPVVPLLLLPKRVFQNNETLDAAVEIANFGPGLLRDYTVKWSLFDHRRKIANGALRPKETPVGSRAAVGDIVQPLASVDHASELTIEVAIPGTSIANRWSIWVYPAVEKPAVTNSVEIFSTPSADFYKALEENKRVLFIPKKQTAIAPLAVQFTPVFWNPIMFPNQPGTMGAMINPRHPVFADFPTASWTDWQWWELLHHGFAIDLAAFPLQVEAPLRFVDKFNRNSLPAGIVEAQVGPSKLVICTLDIEHNLDSRPVARQLRRSILSYMNSDAFRPRKPLTTSELRKMFRAPPKRIP